MSFVNKTYCFFEKVKAIFQNKSLQKYAVFVLSFALLIGFFLNSYSVSANGDKVNTVEVYEGTYEFRKALDGSEAHDSAKQELFGWADTSINLFTLMWPEGSDNYQALVDDPDVPIGYKLGLVGAIDAPISAMLDNPPRIDVTEHLAQEWIPNYEQTGGVYAESGYQMLQGSANITELWGFLRNIAYMLFVVVFIVAGFMIMFRHKLGGQTMVTVYNTLPNIVVGLVLVTFSFAIVGFMLDIGAVLIRVVSGLLEISDPVDATDPFGVMGSYIHLSGSQIIKAFTSNILSLVAGYLFLFMGSIISLIIMLAVIGVIVSASIKIFFTLIKAYVAILFDTIASPIVFAMATIPGQKHVMKDWFNRVVKNILVFVLVFTLINLPIYFIEKGFADEGFTLFGGDLQGAGSGVGGEFGAQIIMVGIAIYMLFLAANCPKMLDDFFPQQGNKTGMKEATGGAKADLAKVPLVGGFFKG